MEWTLTRGAPVELEHGVAHLGLRLRIQKVVGRIWHQLPKSHAALGKGFNGESGRVKLLSHLCRSAFHHVYALFGVPGQRLLLSYHDEGQAHGAGQYPMARLQLFPEGFLLLLLLSIHQQQQIGENGCPIFGNVVWFAEIGYRQKQDESFWRGHIRRLLPLRRLFGNGYHHRI